MILFKDESYRIIGACFEVYNGSGCGFLGVDRASFGKLVAQCLP